MTEILFHPLANILPLMEGRELDELVAELAEEAGLTPLAVASQARRDPHANAGRYEHLMALSLPR